MRDLVLGASMALVLAGTVGACSSSSSTTGGGTPEQACGDALAAFCNRAQSCAPFFIQAAFGDVATCIARQKLTCHTRVTATGSGATASKLEACSQALAAASCDDILSGNTPAACQISGSLGAGTACGDDSQCAAGYCKKSTGSCGVCSARSKAGEACAGTADCTPGLACQGTCVMPGAAGAACSASQPCQGSLVCLVTAGAGTCTIPVGAGAACDPQSQNCDSRQGLFCNPLTTACATVQVVANGGACGLTGGSFSVCTAAGKCSGALAGTCLAAAADGAACDTTNGPNCVSPATCINGLCQLPDPSSCR